MSRSVKSSSPASPALRAVRLELQVERLSQYNSELLSHIDTLNKLLSSHGVEPPAPPPEPRGRVASMGGSGTNSQPRSLAALKRMRSGSEPSAAKQPNDCEGRSEDVGAGAGDGDRPHDGGSGSSGGSKPHRVLSMFEERLGRSVRELSASLSPDRPSMVVFSGEMAQPAGWGTRTGGRAVFMDPDHSISLDAHDLQPLFASQSGSALGPGSLAGADPFAPPHGTLPGADSSVGELESSGSIGGVIRSRSVFSMGGRGSPLRIATLGPVDEETSHSAEELRAGRGTTSLSGSSSSSESESVSHSSSVALSGSVVSGVALSGSVVSGVALSGAEGADGGLGVSDVLSDSSAADSSDSTSSSSGSVSGSDAGDMDDLHARFLPSEEPPTLDMVTEDDVSDPASDGDSVFDSDNELTSDMDVLADAAAGAGNDGSAHSDAGADTDIAPLSGSASVVASMSNASVVSVVDRSLSSGSKVKEGGSGSQSSDDATRDIPPPPTVPAPWKPFWSEKYERYYFVNEDTAASVWRLPNVPDVGRKRRDSSSSVASSMAVTVTGPGSGPGPGSAGSGETGASGEDGDAFAVSGLAVSLAPAPVDVSMSRLVYMSGDGSTGAGGGELTERLAPASSSETNLLVSGSSGNLMDRWKRRASVASLAGVADGSETVDQPVSGSSKSLVVISEPDPETGEVGTVATYLRAPNGEMTIMTGTLDYLVRHLASEEPPDTVFIDSFLLNYRDFVAPLELMAMLISRFNLEIPADATPEEEAYYMTWKNPVRIRVVNVISKWIDRFWWDFAASSALREGLGDFISLTEVEFPSLTRKLLAKIAEREAEAGQELEDLDVASAGIVGCGGVVKGPVSLAALQADAGATVLRFPPTLLAHVLTHLEMRLFAAVPAPQFLMQLNKHASVPHYVRYIDRFNALSAWVSTQVVVCPTPKARAKIIQHFIQVMIKLVKLNNYNSLMAVMSGLANTAVSRLDASWAKVSSRSVKAKRKIEALMQPSQNYARYRAVLDGLTPPAVPFLGLFMQDLLHHADCAPAEISGRINFSKFEAMSSIVTSLIRFQTSDYTKAFASSLKSNNWDLAVALLSQLYVMPDKDMYRISKQLEARKRS